jgi:hypothetical protein
MGPFMERIVPSSFYRVDGGLQALSFSPGFNVRSRASDNILPDY